MTHELLGMRLPWSHPPSQQLAMVFQHLCKQSEPSTTSCDARRNSIDGVLQLYQQPLDFIILPASRRHLLPALTLLLKPVGACVIITGVKPMLRNCAEYVAAALGQHCHRTW